jgi:hypothetical protein
MDWKGYAMTPLIPLSEVDFEAYQRAARQARNEAFRAAGAALLRLFRRKR